MCHRAPAQLSTCSSNCSSNSRSLQKPSPREDRLHCPSEQLHRHRRPPVGSCRLLRAQPHPCTPPVPPPALHLPHQLHQELTGAAVEDPSTLRSQRYELEGAGQVRLRLHQEGAQLALFAGGPCTRIFVWIQRFNIIKPKIKIKSSWYKPKLKYY